MFCSYERIYIITHLVDNKTVNTEFKCDPNRYKIEINKKNKAIYPKNFIR